MQPGLVTSHLEESLQFTNERNRDPERGKDLPKVTR